MSHRNACALNFRPEHRVTLGHMMEKLAPDSAREYIRTRFPGFTRAGNPDVPSKKTG
jgi:hypothetical protein